MESSFGLMFLDVAPAPLDGSPWSVLILLLVIIFVLSVSFAAGLVFLLIWLKRRKANSP